MSEASSISTEYYVAVHTQEGKVGCFPGDLSFCVKSAHTVKLFQDHSVKNICGAMCTLQKLVTVGTELQKHLASYSVKKERIMYFIGMFLWEVLNHLAGEHLKFIDFSLNLITFCIFHKNHGSILVYFL